MVCIQTRVKRRISRESSVWKVLSVKIMAYHLHVDFLDVLGLVVVLEILAATPGDDIAAVDERYILAERLGLLQVMRREENGHPTTVELPDVAPQLVAQLHVHT